MYLSALDEGPEFNIHLVGTFISEPGQDPEAPLLKNRWRKTFHSECLMVVVKMHTWSSQKKKKNQFKDVISNLPL